MRTVRAALERQEICSTTIDGEIPMTTRDIEAIAPFFDGLRGFAVQDADGYVPLFDRVRDA